MQTKILANRIREVFLSGKWIANTNFKEQLESINLTKANQKVGHLNTIALLAFHINYYVSGIINFFENGSLDIKDKYSFDMPAMQSETEWNDFINIFLCNAEILAKHIEQMNDDILSQVFVNEKYGTYLRNIEGIIEHSYYHLGQISLLKKMIESENSISK